LVQQGSGTKIIVAQERTFGNAHSGEYYVLPFVSENLKYKRNALEVKKINTHRNPNAPVFGSVSVEGDISFELSWQHRRLLQHVIGKSKRYATYLNGVLQEALLYGGPLPSGLTFEKYYPDIDGGFPYFRYTGCKVNKFKASFSSEGMIECSISILGKAETLDNDSVAAYEADPGHDPFDGFQATITDRDGNTLGDIVSFEFEVDNQLTSEYRIGLLGERSEIREGVGKVTGTLTALFNDITLYENAKNETGTSIKVVLQRGNGDGTEGNEKFTFRLDEIKLLPEAPTIEGPQGMLVTAPFESYYGSYSGESAVSLTMESLPLSVDKWESGVDWETYMNWGFTGEELE